MKLDPFVPPGMLLSLAPQGSEEWLQARRGVITASNFRTCRERLKGTPEKIDKKTGEITPAVRGDYSKAARLYAMNVAREIVGGMSPGLFQTQAMARGKTEEQFARIAYEATTGAMVDEAGFLFTEDRKYGCSVDGLVFEETRGGTEIKLMVSSDTLFTSLIDGDLSEFIDQCHGNIWLWHLDWIDLILWAPDMPGDLKLKVIRIERDDDYIEALQADLTEFDQMVQGYVAKLRKAICEAAEIPDDVLDEEPEGNAATVAELPAAPPAAAPAPSPAPAPAPKPAQAAPGPVAIPLDIFA